MIQSKKEAKIENHTGTISNTSILLSQKKTPIKIASETLEINQNLLLSDKNSHFGFFIK
jgi:hypothetical protein